MQVSGGGVTAVHFAYNHDARGRIISITDLAPPPTAEGAFLTLPG